MALGEAALGSGLLGHIRCGGNQAEGHEGAEEQGDELVRTFFMLLPPYAGQPAATRTASPLLATWTASALTSMWAVLP